MKTSEMQKCHGGIMEMVEKVVRKLFGAANLSTQEKVGSVVYGALKYVILHLMKPAVLAEMNDNHVSKYMEALKAPKAFGKRSVHDKEFRSLTASIVQNKTMDSIADRKLVHLESPSRRTSANKDASTAAKAIFVQEAPPSYQFRKP